jgi:hypothetical protein
MTDDPNAAGDRKHFRSSALGLLLFAGIGTAVVLGIAAAVGLPARMMAVVFFFMIAFFLICLALLALLSFLDRLISKPARVDLTNRVDTPNVVVYETHPGKMLPHQLQPAGLSLGCQFGCILGFALFWNGIVGGIVFKMVNKWNGGGFRSADLLIIPHVIVGLMLIGVVLLAGSKWLTASLVGRVNVELSAHPLAPAEEFRVHVAQKGLCSLAHVALWLVCTEEAAYPGRKGSRRTETQEVAKYPISNLDQIPDDSSLPITVESRIPDGAMHSFTAPNNEINWTIRVEGVVLGFLPFATDYRLSVAPVQEEGA